MSHTTKISAIAIRDVEALRKTVADLQTMGKQVRLVENAKPRMYFGHQEVQCDFVVKLPGRFDLGLEKQRDGSYNPIFDAHANIVHQSIGASCGIPQTPEEVSMWHIGLFAQTYAANAAINQAVAEGATLIANSVDAQGNRHLQLQYAMAG